jgi:hypothetical protein
MSESNAVPSKGTEGSTSFSDILDHLPPEVAATLGKSRTPAPAPKAESSEEEESDHEEPSSEELDAVTPEIAEESDEEEAKEEDDDEHPVENDKVQKRIDKLTKKRREAEELADSLKEEKARLEQELEKRSAIKIEATPDDPLADIESMDELDAKVSAAKKVRSWALSNPDGATVQNPDGTERYVDRSEMAKYIAQTDALLTDHAPTRRQYLAERAQIIPEAKKTYPQLFKSGTPEHKILTDTLKAVPALKRLPGFEMVIGDAITGMNARLGATAKSQDGTTKAAAKAQPKSNSKVIAPPVPKPVGSRPPSTSGKASHDLRAQVLGGNASIDNLTKLFAAR